MSRSVYDDELHAHFVTFSCRRRRTILDHARPNKIVLGVLNDELKSHQAVCSGFVLMPNHIHVLLWFPKPNQLSKFIQKWKQRSSRLISDFLEENDFEYANKFGDDTSIWERKFYDFNVTSDQKYREKLDYMHLNPVRAGLVERATDWRWSSARHYLQGRSVGVTIKTPPGIGIEIDNNPNG